MTSTTSMTMIKMLDTLPEVLQDRVLEHMRDYVQDLRDEMQWDESFSRSRGNLVSAARMARKEIEKGKATPLNTEML